MRCIETPVRADPRVDARPATFQDTFFSEGVSYGDGKTKDHWVDPGDLVPSGHGLLLDLGCGGGTTKKKFEAKGYRWIGLDIVNETDPTVVGDAHRLPFQNESFAVIYSSQVFEHLPEPHRAVEEVARVLKPGGVFCGSVSCLEPFHDSYFNYTHRGLEILLRGAGLTPTRIEAGPSGFLVILHHLVDGGGPQLALPIAKLTVRPFLGMLQALGRLFIVLRYGPRSPQMSKLEAYFRKFPLRFAGHIQFAAEKRAAGDQRFNPPARFDPRPSAAMSPPARP